MNDNYRGQIVFMCKDFIDFEEYQKAVTDQIFLLLKGRYKLKIYTELGEAHQTIIEFGHDNPDYPDLLEWLSEDEVEAVERCRWKEDEE